MTNADFHKSRQRQFIDQRTAFGLHCKKCRNQLEEPMIAQKCLHRFCTPCVRNRSHCPSCGAKTHFKVDLNFVLIISKLKCQGKRFRERKILDKMCEDGTQLSISPTSSSGRRSRLAVEQKKSAQTFRASFASEGSPSTSYNFASNELDKKSPKKCDGAIQIDADSPNRNMSIPKISPILHNYISPSNTEFADDSWQKMNCLMNSRQPLSKDLQDVKPIVLWPDGDNYKLRELPRCLLRPRYLLVPPESTVAHFVEYLYKRAELESAKIAKSLRTKFRIEMMPIEEEREELHFRIDPERNIEYLPNNFGEIAKAANQTRPMLVFGKTKSASHFSTKLIMRHPWEVLAENRTLDGLLAQFQAAPQSREASELGLKRPLKLVFRFILRN